MKYWNRQYRIDFPEPKKTVSKKEPVFIPVEVSNPIKEEVVSKKEPIKIHIPMKFFCNAPLISVKKN